MVKKRIVAALIALVMLFLSACGQQTVPTEPSEAIPTETTVQTLPPTEPPTQPPTEAPTEPTEPPFQLHSGIREDGSFDEGALFIGDSLTYCLVVQYLMTYGLLGDARWMAIIGAPVEVYFSAQRLYPNDIYNCTYSSEFYNLSYSQSVEQAGESVTAVYYMMGTNYDPKVNADTYIQIMDSILEKCPNATVYLQLIPYNAMSYVPYEEVNQIIQEAYQHYQQQENSRVQLIDTYTAIGHNLSDGIHLTLQGLEYWYNALLAFAEENNIPQ